MKRSFYSGTLWLAMVMGSSTVSVCTAQQVAAVPPAPLPSQIASAKKAFISNAEGEELDPRVFFVSTMGPTQPYDKFYAAIKSGGRFDLVSAPADADLILEIRFSYELGANNAGGDSDLRVAIRDPKTNVLLWALSRHVVASGGFHFGEKRETNFDQAMAALVGDLNLLASPTVALAGPTAK